MNLKSFVFFVNLQLYFMFPLFSQSSINTYTQANALDIDSTNFTLFAKKIEELKNGQRSKIRVVHVGDSHIQPGQITDVVRERMQEKFGAGGRGLVFPYQLAKTFGPTNYKFKSHNSWENWSFLFRPYKIEIGLTGFGLESTAAKSSLTFSIPNSAENQQFDRGFLIYAANAGDTVALENSFSVSHETTLFDTLSFKLDKAAMELSVAHQGQRFNFQGLYLENSQPGIVCSSIGVAGAKHADYLENPLFFQQLPLLQPDLLIISMGTNESFENQFDAALFQQRLDTFYVRIQREFPTTAVIVTGAGDCFKTKRNRKVKNENLLTINQILRSKCSQYGFAFWDFYNVMGGDGSMEKWQQAGLAERDNIHLTEKGYRLQGELLQIAIENALQQSH